MSTLSTQQENLYLNAPTFFVCPKSVKIILIVAVILCVRICSLASVDNADTF